MTRIVTTIDAQKDTRGQMAGKLLVLIGKSDIGVKGTQKRIVGTKQAKTEFGGGPLVDMINIVAANGVGEVLAVTLGPEVTDPATSAVTSPVAQDYQDALDAVLNDENYGFILIDDTTAAYQDKLKAHVGSAESNGKFRAALSAGTTADAGTINSGRVWMCDKNLLMTDGTDAPGYLIAAATAAVISTEQDTAMPVHTLELKGFGGVKTKRLDDENDVLSDGGLITFTQQDGKVVIYRAVTTYTKDADGNPDTKYQEITTVRTGDYVTEDLRAKLRQRYPRIKGTDDERQAIGTDMNTWLEDHQRTERIKAFEPVVLAQNPNDAKRWIAPVLFYVYTPVGVIQLESHIIV